MAILIDQFPLREAEPTPTVDTIEKWPDRHPRSKPRTCDLCGAEARLYVAGPKCDEHSPSAMRKAGAS